MQKIVFTDLDGTLLNNESKVSDYTADFLKHFTSLGNKLVLSSGRSLPSIIKVKDDNKLDIPGVYIIATNGTLIYDCDTKKSIYESRLNLDDVSLIWEMANKAGIHIQTYTDDELIVPEIDKETTYYTVRCPLPVICSKDPVSALSKLPCKMLLIDLDNKQKLIDFCKILEEKFPHLITLFSNDYYVEIIDRKAGKGSGLKWLCNYLNIPVSDSFAFGDAPNDISMIEAAGTGVAMQNADKEVLEIADKITENSNNSDGLAHFLEKVLKIEPFS